MRMYRVKFTNPAEIEAEQIHEVAANSPADAVTSAPHGYWIKGYTWIQRGRTFYAIDKLSNATITATATALRKPVHL